ncbi:MAG: hypothetical protein D6693_01780, partial [Planctomycetota bacterium]
MPARLAIAITLATAVAGCSREETLSPPEARAGVDACAACGMMLADTRFAGALAVREGGLVERRVYDDIGEMLAVPPPAAEHAFYVVAFDTGAWVEADDATYVHAPSVMTPMATGVVAFSSADAADAFAREHAGV